MATICATISAGEESERSGGSMLAPRTCDIKKDTGKTRGRGRDAAMWVHCGYRTDARTVHVLSVKIQTQPEFGLEIDSHRHEMKAEPKSVSTLGRDFYPHEQNWM